MMTRTFSLIALCAALTACNSKTPEPTAAATDAVTPAAEAPVVPSAAPAVAMKPAPDGLPSRVARETLTASGQKCASVAKADRNAQDGSIVASCSSGETYRIYTEEGKGAVAAPM